MQHLREFIEIITHLDKHLNEWAHSMGGWLYALLFLVIFAETGLVITPFLPGDSLLFAIGALCASPQSGMEIGKMIPLLIIASILGDAVNYSIGKRLGPSVFTSETSKLLNKKHLLRTEEFYERYGGKTIIIARFIPIIRTFAPFVAGVGKMSYTRFLSFNVIGGVVWVSLFIAAGYVFGNLEPVKRQFHYVILAIIVLSILPAVIEILRERARTRTARP